MWILFVEDEQSLGNSIKRGLEEEAHVVDLQTDGEEAEMAGMANDYDLVILDWRLPSRSGKEVLEAWRSEGREFPVIMLTALGDIDHKVTGLDAGADDYMSKPFSFEELLARVRALGRRKDSHTSDNELQYGPVLLKQREKSVYICDKQMEARTKEYMILELFLNQPEAVWSKTQIAERVWGDPYYISDNTIEVTISNLRQKIHNHLKECVDSPKEKGNFIQSLRGMGYRLNKNFASDAE